MGRVYIIKALVQVGVLACLIMPYAKASTSIDPANKHAWSENSGWINAAPTNGVVTLRFDGTTGYLTGLAWGENIGWIKVGSDAGGPYGNDSSTNWGVNMDASGFLSGYAWGENVGWIKFAHPYGGVKICTSNGEFSANAWGENIGWITFKGSAPDYNVRTRAFDTQAHGTPNWWLAYYNTLEDYDDGDGVPAWAEYLADTDPTNAGSFFQITGVSGISPINVQFPSSTRRSYTLQRRDDMVTGEWVNVEGQVAKPGAGGADSLNDNETSTQHFYRVMVTLPVAP